MITNCCVCVCVCVCFAKKMGAGASAAVWTAVCDGVFDVFKEGIEGVGDDDTV